MYIDPHVHMVSRTTDDYQRMALAGCVAMCVGSCCASVSCKLCSCACIVPPNIASNIYVITLALISMWALLMRSHGSDIAAIGGNCDVSNGRQVICHRMPDREGHWKTASKLFEPVGRRRQA